MIPTYFPYFGYRLLLSQRLSGCCGGLGFPVKASLPSPCISIYHNFSYSDFLTLSLTQKYKFISITLIYKPPKPEMASFLCEFNDIATNLISSPRYHPIFIGYFNYQCNSTSNPDIMFTNLTNSLSQHNM